MTTCPPMPVVTHQCNTGAKANAIQPKPIAAFCSDYHERESTKPPETCRQLPPPA